MTTFTVNHLDETRIYTAVGYGPRVVQLSFDSKVAFVGCKDGSISVVPLEENLFATPEAKVLPDRVLMPPDKSPPMSRSVRAICPLDGTKFLVGRDSGSIETRWQNDAVRHIEHTGTATETPVASISWLNQDLLFASWRDVGPRLLATRTDKTTWRELPRLKELRNLVFVVRLDCNGESGWLCADRQGEVYVLKLRDNELVIAERTHLPGQVGFVTDYAVLKPPCSDRFTSITQEVASAVIVAADESIHLLTYGDRGIEAYPVALPGFSENPIALTCCTLPEGQQTRRLLWVADSAGASHLFLNSGEPLVWQRAGVRENQDRALTANSWPLASRHLVVSGCRNGQVIFSSYGRVNPQLNGFMGGQSRELDAPNGDLHDKSTLRAWVGMLPETILASDWEWAAGHRNHEMFAFLRHPHIADIVNVVCDAENNILASHDANERFCRAIALWRDTIMGIIQRFPRAIRVKAALGAVRLFRQIYERFKDESGVAGLRAEVETAVRQIRRWIIFGQSYREGTNLRARLEALEQVLSDRSMATSFNDDHEFDALAYEAILFHERFDIEEIWQSKAQQAVGANWRRPVVFTVCDTDARNEDGAGAQQEDVAWVHRSDAPTSPSTLHWSTLRSPEYGGRTEVLRYEFEPRDPHGRFDGRVPCLLALVRREGIVALACTTASTESPLDPDSLSLFVPRPAEQTMGRPVTGALPKEEPGDLRERRLAAPGEARKSSIRG